MGATEIVITVAVVLLASVGQSVTGFGFGLIAVPFLVLVLDVRDAVVVSTVLGTVSVALVAVRVWRAAPWRMVGWLLAGSVAGMPLGLALLVFASQDVLRILVGVSALVMGGALAMGLRLRAKGARSEVAVGLMSGVLRTSTSMSGPPVVIYLLGRGEAPEPFRAALATYFLIGSAISIGAFAGADVISGHSLALSGVALPFVYAGSVMGERLLRRVDRDQFGRLVLALLVATALSGVASSIQRLVT